MSAHEILKAYVQEVETEVFPDDAITDDPQVDKVYPEPPDTLLNNIKGEPSFCRVLSKHSKYSAHLTQVSTRSPIMKPH
jgi:hypothetical protein